MISKQLNSVKSLMQQYFAEGKIIPMEFSFPAFEIDSQSFKHAVVDILHEKVMYAVDMGEYKNIIPDTSYEDLYAAQCHVKQGIATMKETGMMVFIDNILPQKITQDANMAPRELYNNAINSICVNQMNDSLREIDHLSSFSAPFGELRSALENEKNDFVASMIMIKDELPAVYRQLQQSLPLYPNQEIVTLLKKIEASPDITIVSRIYEHNEKMAEEKFPQLVKEIKKLEQPHSPSFRF